MRWYRFNQCFLNSLSPFITRAFPADLYVNRRWRNGTHLHLQIEVIYNCITYNCTVGANYITLTDGPKNNVSFLQFEIRALVKAILV